MKKAILLPLFVLAFAFFSFAQNVGIGVTNPSEKLEVNGNLKTDTIKTNNIRINNGAGIGRILVSDAAGNGIWQINLPTDGWSLKGNSGTDPLSNFIGTTDNNPLKFRTGDSPMGWLQHAPHLIAWGDSALFDITSGTNNIAIGQGALRRNTNKSFLVAIGDSALYNNSVGASGSFQSVRNTAVGARTLRSNTVGSDNSALGANALSKNTSGTSNTSMGSESMKENTTGFGNTVVGANTLQLNSTGAYNTAVGFAALSSNTENYNTAVGATALTFNETGGNNTAVGYSAMYANVSGWSNTAIGLNALRNNRSDLNTAVGNSSLNSNTFGIYNTAIGASSLNNNTLGNGNTALGTQANYFSVSGDSNVAVGYRSLYNNSTGNENTALGTEALSGMAAGHGNTAIGFKAYSNTQGVRYNTTIGHSSNVNGTLIHGTAIGAFAFVSANNTMVFGKKDSVLQWGFGRSAVDPWAALQVGNSGFADGNGAYLTPGGTWTNTSDRNQKEQFEELDGKSILKRINELTVTRWKYKGTSNEYHIGPMAQDFFRLFSVGTSDRSISTIDPSGIALIGIQELSRQQQEMEIKLAEIEVLKKQNLLLQQRLDALEKLIREKN